MCILGPFQIAAFVVNPVVSESAGEPFKGNTSVPYSPLGLLDLSPHWFSNPDIVGAHTSGAGPKGWGA